MQEQIAEGDVAARNRRRKGSPTAQALEVNNVETKRLIEALTSLKQ